MDLGAAGILLHDAGMRRPTLDDVFLKLTGHAAEKAATDDGTEETSGTGGTAGTAKKGRTSQKDARDVNVESVR